jgi:UDP-N-acetylmuramate dehydrogenase
LITSSFKPEENYSPAAVTDDLLQALTIHVRGRIVRNEPMASHTTFRVGGPADLFLAPADAEDLAVMLELLYAAHVPVRVIGNGSNLLVADAGIRGAVICLTPHFASLTHAEDMITAGAGAKLWRAVHYAAEQSLSGLESTMGIPGTIGGALVMNAGTDVGSISDLVVSADFLTASGERLVKSGEQLDYGYRCSALQGGNLIVLSTQLRLTPSAPDVIRAKMTRLEAKRTSRQPTRCHTAGSTFKNPEDIAAGKLLDRAGAKGYRIGGAEVSEKHANFILAHTGATASDIRNLAHWMHRRVHEAFGYDLEMEIELLGEWTEWQACEAW